MPHLIIDNRYKILRKLGSGAMGEVYKVRDLKDNRLIALKVLSSVRTSTESVQRFKREFSLLAGLHHPNLCPVYDFGLLKDGRSYFTMEYIDGLDIFKATQGLGDKDIYPWVVQLCRVLEYIHAKGLIHYDIKPNNVLIQMSNGNIGNTLLKLMDFGLAGEQRIKGGLIIKGTFPYIAPEIIKGFSIDHRIDLYSLGVLLYEVFTRRPFQIGRTQESFTAQLRQEIMKSPPMSLKFMPQTNKNLRRLLIRLTAIEPNQRYSRANEVTKDISKIAGCRFEFETEKTIEGYLLSSHFVGRDKEMGLLKTLYEQSRSDNGKLVLITGESGIGKSRLLKEFRVFAQLHNIHCFIGYAYKETTQSLEPFYTIFKELINYIDDGSIPKMPMAILFRMFPDLRKKHWAEKLPKLVLLEPKQEWLRNFDALFSLLQYATSNLGNIIILLENLQWADDLSIQFLEYLAHNLERSNILICGSCRSEEIISNLKLRQIINNLREEGLLTNLELKPLNFMNLRSFLDSTITPASNSFELIKYLMQKTGGNPFFVEEIMRNLMKRSKVSIGERMRIEDLKQIAIPETIEDLVLTRLKDLDNDSQMVIKFGAVLLKDFSYDGMKNLTALNDTELSRALWGLKRKQILIEEGDNYRFYHATMGEAINKRLSQVEKKRLNYQIAKALETVGHERKYEDLAYYYINARDHKKGVLYGLKAAEKAGERYANEQAINFFRGVLSLLDYKKTRLRFDILQKLAQIEFLSSHYDDATKHYNQALSVKNTTNIQKAAIYRKIGDVYRKKPKYARALAYYKKGLSFLKNVKSRKHNAFIKGALNTGIAYTYLGMGNYSYANEFNLSALEFLKANKTKEALMLQNDLYYSKGIIDINLGDYDKAFYNFRQAYESNKKIKHEIGMVLILYAFGYGYYLKGDLERAFRYYKRSMETSEKIGNPRGVSRAMIQMACIYFIKGKCVQALDHFQRAISISTKIGNRREVALSLEGIGNCYMMLCDCKNAEMNYKRALELWHELSVKDNEALTILDLGNIHQTVGDYDLALRCYRKAFKVFNYIARPHEISLCNAKMASLFIDIGEFSKAVEFINNALKLTATIDSKTVRADCNRYLCFINLIRGDYAFAYDYYKKGTKIAKNLGFKKDIIWFSILLAEIYYFRSKYLQAFSVANKSLSLARETGTKDLCVRALLMKIKNGTKQNILSEFAAIELFNEAVRVAEEIGYPETLWKVYFEYGNFLKENKKRLQALRYYRQAIMILKNVVARIRNQSYRNSYLMRPDRKAVIEAISET